MSSSRDESGTGQTIRLPLSLARSTAKIPKPAIQIARTGLVARRPSSTRSALVLLCSTPASPPLPLLLLPQAYAHAQTPFQLVVTPCPHRCASDHFCTSLSLRVHCLGSQSSSYIRPTPCQAHLGSSSHHALFLPFTRSIHHHRRAQSRLTHPSTR